MGVTRDDFWGFDVKMIHSDCHMLGCIHKRERNVNLHDGTPDGQYAIYVSDEAKSFPCKNVKLKISMHESDFEVEVPFASSENNRNGLPPRSEYSEF